MMKSKLQVRFCPKRILKYIPLYLAAILLAAVFAAKLAVPEKYTFYCSSDTDGVTETLNIEAQPGTYTVQATLFGSIPIKDVNVEIIPDRKLIPVGDVFGVKFFTKGVIVIGTTDIETADGMLNPAEKAGICKNDIITSVNGMEINTVENLAEIVENSKGNTVFVEYTRNNETLTCELKPELSLSDKKYKSGIWVRDSTAGIGTITYYNPENNTFAGLGHGICDVDTGELMPLLKGAIVDVEIVDIIKGKPGVPGELKGSFSPEMKGMLQGNTNAGVFGSIDMSSISASDALPVASKTEICEGPAEILSNVTGKGVEKYTVKLSKIDKRSDGTKCFVVEVTDSTLLDLTGGIVQGMSGSPIVQNGKLVGAVTHVFVNDPTRGYGIFIENMLAEAED